MVTCRCLQTPSTNIAILPAQDSGQLPSKKIFKNHDISKTFGLISAELKCADA